MPDRKILAGVDLVPVSKIRASHKRFQDKFLRKVLTVGEISYCRKKKNLYQSIAARFAAKEAFKKAFSGVSGMELGWREVEIIAGRNRVPGLKLSGRIRKKLGRNKTAISLSHTQDYAFAVVLIYR
ncbi:MAG: holo-ACP synthase [candidate division Zixibacteria bacterium]|nr:holo-ACP synthase [candidate division Zixibacteria bacterium]